jgi:hypothetical protein
MAALRNLGIGALTMAGHASMAAACRHHARDATRATYYAREIAVAGFGRESLQS